MPQVGDAYVRLHIDGTGLNREVRNALDGLKGPIRDKGKEHGETYSDGFSDGFDGRILDRFNDQVVITDRNVRRLGNRFRRTDRDADHFGRTLGRFFGAGARNDFLNIFGRLTGTVAQLGFALGDLSGRILGGIISKFTRLGSVLTKGGPGVGGVAGLVGAVFLLSEAFQSAVAFGSGVVGIGTSLAASFTYALAGSITAVGGALFYAGAGIGVAALAIANLTKEQKDALKPITEDWKELGETAAEAFGPALVRNVTGIRRILQRLNPIVEAVGEAMGHVLDDLVASLNGPEWRRFFRTFEHRAPGIIENLGGAFTNFGEIFAGVMRAATPLIERFAGWLETSSEKLSDWINSTEGQNKLKTFFDDAAESAKVWGDLIGEAVEALANIFAPGKGTGDSIVEDITGALEDFNDWATSPEGQDAMEDWFTWAEDLSGKLGEIGDSLITIGDALDNADSRTNMGNILDAINGIDTGLGKIKAVVNSPWFQNFPKALGDKIASLILDTDWSGLWTDFYAEATKANDWLGAKLRGFFSSVGAKISDWIGAINWTTIVGNPSQRVREQVSGMGSKISTWAGKVEWGKVFGNPWTDYLFGKIQGLAAKISTAAGDVNWSDIFNDPWTTLRNKVTGLGAKIAELIGSINLSVNIDWPSPPDWFTKYANKLPGVEIGESASGGIFNGAQHRIIGEAGAEAVVPLNRPLGMVDPAVRALSAIAQGLDPGPSMSGGTNDLGGGSQYTFNVTTMATDPRAAAWEVMNYVAAAGY